MIPREKYRRVRAYARASLDAAALAARYAQEIGLPPGNMWEPGIARTIAAYLEDGMSQVDVDRDFRRMLGLSNG